MLKLVHMPSYKSGKPQESSEMQSRQHAKFRTEQEEPWAIIEEI